MSNIISRKFANLNSYPLFYAIDCIVVCFALRTFFTFGNQFITLGIAVVLASFNDLLESLITGRTPYIVKEPYWLLIVGSVWGLYNYVNFGYQVFLQLKTVIAVCAGINAGRDTYHGCDIGQIKYRNNFVAFLVGTIAGCGKYGVLALISMQTHNHFRSMDTIAMECVIAALFYIIAKGQYPTKNADIKLITCIITSILNVCRTYVPDYFYLKFFK